MRHQGGKAASAGMGFTLIELLVVIAIMGILSTVAVAATRYARTQARDSKRVADVRTLQKALALYYTGGNTYPNPTVAAGQCLTNADSVSTLLKAGAAPAIGKVPVDPTCPATTTCCFLYTSTNGSTYTLRYTLETSSKAGTVGNHTVTPI